MSPSRAFSVLVFLLSILFAASSAQAQASKGSLTVPVTGAVAEGPLAGPVAGTFKIERFTSDANALYAVGLLTVTDQAGATHIVKNVAWPVKQRGATPSGASPSKGTDSSGRLIRTAMVPVQAGSCDILNLVLGPLHLDLLGLVVDLNQVVLNITAVAGAGNLLGNLLCAITGLLDGTGASVFAELARLLNQLLGILG